MDTFGAAWLFRRASIAALDSGGLLKSFVDGATKTAHDCYRLTRQLGCLSLQPQGKPEGRALVSYILNACFYDGKAGSSASRLYYHANSLRTRIIVQVLLDLGYAVDVVSDHNSRYVPSREYDVLISSRLSFERLAQMAGQSCVKVVHLDTADVLFDAVAELQRLQALQTRRHITLPPRRLEPPHRALEYADFATLTGNEFTLATYEHARIPIYATPSAPVTTYPWREDKDFAACGKRFLWMASEGMIHKGLDLTLESFAGMPDLELFVCGPVAGEPEFAAAFRRELYETSNIHTLGWMDTRSPEFTELANRCCALVYPSCSEGQAGAVVTAIHAGLIPIVSYESGVDVGSFGQLLDTCSIEEIRTRVRECANLSPAERKARARCAWNHARRHHTSEQFASVYREAIDQILAPPQMARAATA
jgi:hypothetical protein